MRFRSLPLVFAWLLLGALPLCAQESRAELLERQRAEKAKTVTPYEASGVESALVWVERQNPLVKIAPYNGFYIQYGYSEKPIGSGIGVGGGWRHDLFDRQARAVIEVAGTMRGYKYVRGDVALQRLANERLEVGIQGTYREDPQEDFFGLGIDSLKENRTDFLYEASDVQGRVVFKPHHRVRTGVRLGHLDVTVGNGTDDRFTDIGNVFGDITAPGLAAQPAFNYTDVFASFDGRDDPLGARAGAFYTLSWRRYNDGDLERYSFDRINADVQHFLPFFGRKRVIATRVRLHTTRPLSGNDVPFYLQPTLGGSDSLRSASDFRYRDRNMFLLNAEYRWEAFSGLDMALFTDHGSVAPKVGDFDLGDMKRAYGVGFRFNANQAVWLRFDVATGTDGAHLFIKFSGNF